MYVYWAARPGCQLTIWAGKCFMHAQACHKHYFVQHHCANMAPWEGGGGCSIMGNVGGGGGQHHLEFPTNPPPPPNNCKACSKAVSVACQLDEQHLYCILAWKWRSNHRDTSVVYKSVGPSHSQVAAVGFHNFCVLILSFINQIFEMTRPWPNINLYRFIFQDDLLNPVVAPGAWRHLPPPPPPPPPKAWTTCWIWIKLQECQVSVIMYNVKVSYTKLKFTNVTISNL